MASRGRKRSTAERLTNYKTVAIALGVILFAIGLFTVSLNDRLWSESSIVPTVLTELGGLLCVSAALTLLWELGAKREFLDEVWEKARVSDSVRETGLVAMFDDFQRLDWGENFEGTKRFDAYFAGGTSFRRSHQKFFEDLIDTPGATINVYLPDPENPKIVKELSLRFGRRYTEEKVRERLTDAIEDFREARSTAGTRGAMLNVRLVPFAPLYTLYRCDDKFVFTPYRHRPYEQKGTVPVFVFKRGGSIYDYFEREINYLNEVEGTRDAFAPRGTVRDEARP